MMVDRFITSISGLLYLKIYVKDDELIKFHITTLQEFVFIYYRKLTIMYKCYIASIKKSIFYIQ